MSRSEKQTNDSMNTASGTQPVVNSDVATGPEPRYYIKPQDLANDPYRGTYITDRTYETFVMSVFRWGHGVEEVNAFAQRVCDVLNDAEGRETSREQLSAEHKVLQTFSRLLAKEIAAELKTLKEAAA